MALQIKKGDTVRVRTGKDKGPADRRVLAVYRGDNGRVAKVLVEHVNMVRRHKRASAKQQGGIQEKEAPIDISNVMLVDPQTKRAVRYGVSIVADGKKKARVAKKTNNPIP